jgi:hypothetical protein
MTVCLHVIIIGRVIDFLSCGNTVSNFKFNIMKNSKLFLLVIFALCIQAVNAQTFGIKGGVNFANLSVSSGGMTVSPKSITGFHIGPVADFHLKDMLYFNTGLLYSLKGAKVEGDEFSPNEQIKINYLEIPLNLAYKFPLKEKSDFFIQAGPYVGYGLSGTDEYGEESIDLFSDEGGGKRFDYGLGFGGGVDFGKLVVSIDYQLGLANLIESTSTEFESPDVKVKNKVFQISVAYMFGKK